MNTPLVLLLIYTIAREVFFLYSINKLVNKLMSRNFAEYNHITQGQPVHVDPVVKVFDDAEDLGVLQDLGLPM